MTRESNTDSEDLGDVRQHLRRLNDEWVDALVKRDVAVLDRITADDFIFTYPMDGDSKQQFIADVESGDLRVDMLNRSRVDVHVFGPTAVLSAFDDARWFYKGHEIVGWYRTIHVYSRRQEKWELVAVRACPLSNK